MSWDFTVTHVSGMDPKESGAGSRTRTDDLLITNQLLYQLSYAGRNSHPSTPCGALRIAEVRLQKADSLRTSDRGRLNNSEIFRNPKSGLNDESDFCNPPSAILIYRPS